MVDQQLDNGKPELSSPTADTQSALIESLLVPRAYPHPVAKLELLETHISWVILTGDYAYKIKKPLELSFLDFSTLERRKYFCEQELRLNRKWAPELYLEVVPIGGSAKNLTMGCADNIVEYALRMRQFPQSARLDAQLDNGLLTDNDMVELAEKVASYHRAAVPVDFVSGKVALDRIAAPVRENFPYIRSNVEAALLQPIEDWSEEGIRHFASALIGRHRDGHVRECHGDLHLENLVRLSSGIAAFDCVEFSAELRDIDTISDIAFLAMDLASRGRPDFCYRLMNRYLECGGDYAGMKLFGLYFVYHCMIRAKVAAIRCSERTEESGRERDREELNEYCDIAHQWINRPAPMLVAMHGFSGSGKTWLSTKLLAHLPAIRVRSDIERKRLFALAETEDSGSAVGEGLYAEHAKADVYQLLFALAGQLIESGFNVIVDASFLKRDTRDSVRALADKLRVRCVFVDTCADNAELHRRLAHRVLTSDASEADSSVLQNQLNNHDPMDRSEHETTVRIATDSEIDIDQLVSDIKRIS